MASNAASRLDRLTRRLADFDRIVVTTAGKITHDAVLEQAGRDTGGDRRMSGMSRGKQLDVQITPLSSPTGVRIRPKGKQSGMWSILTDGTSPHVVAANRKSSRGRGRSSRTTAMRVGGAWRAGPWRVGGSSGKSTWTKGRDAGFDESLQKIRAEFREVVKG